MACFGRKIEREGQIVLRIDEEHLVPAHALLTEEPDCDADRVREVLSGDICRCPG